MLRKLKKQTNDYLKMQQVVTLVSSSLVLWQVWSPLQNCPVTLMAVTRKEKYTWRLDKACKISPGSVAVNVECILTRTRHPTFRAYLWLTALHVQQAWQCLVLYSLVVGSGFPTLMGCGGAKSWGSNHWLRNLVYWRVFCMSEHIFPSWHDCLILDVFA